jgi:hypothetical protein
MLRAYRLLSALFYDLRTRTRLRGEEREKTSYCGLSAFKKRRSNEVLVVRHFDEKVCEYWIIKVLAKKVN